MSNQESLHSKSGGEYLDQSEEERLNAAVGEVMKDLECMYCQTKASHHFEVVYTGDEESLFGYEVWYCCHPCRNKRQPCETFFRLG